MADMHSRPAARDGKTSQKSGKKTKGPESAAHDTASSAASRSGGLTGPSPLTLAMNPQTLMQGILYAEILGKPKAKRRGRW